MTIRQTSLCCRRPDRALSRRVVPGRAQVTGDRLGGAAAEPQNWLTYSGTYDGRRFSPLDQITRANVGRLALQWVFQTRVRGATRDDAPGHRRRDVPDDAPEPRLRDRCPHRPAALALRARAPQGHVSLLRPAEPGIRRARRSPVHGHARRPRRGARCQDRPRPLGRRGRRSQRGLQLHGRPAGRQGQGHRRRRRRRVRDPRVHRRLRRRRPGSERGASTRFRAKASRATTAGPAIRGSAAAPRHGSPVRTTRR